MFSITTPFDSVTKILGNNSIFTFFSSGILFKISSLYSDSAIDLYSLIFSCIFLSFTFSLTDSK